MNYITEYHKQYEKFPNRFSKSMIQRFEIDERMLQEYTYQEELVENCIAWIEHFCELVDGENTGKIKLTLPQKYIIAVVFGIWGDVNIPNYDENQNYIGETKEFTRICRNATIMVASGFGKTTFLAAINALILCEKSLFEDAKIFIGSNSYEQSRLCFDTTAKMIKRTKYQNDFNYRESKGEIENSINFGKMKAMSSNGGGMEGIIPALIILDEIHEMKDTEYATNLKKSIKRSDLLIFEITTQGKVRGGYLDTRLEYARKILSGEVVNDKEQFFIWEQDNEQEIKEAYRNNEIDVLFKSNPNLGISQPAHLIFEKIETMINSVSERSTILTKNFNIPQNADNIFFSKKECEAKSFDEGYLWCKGGFIGLDLAKTATPSADFTSISLLVVDPITEEFFLKNLTLIPEFFKNDEKFHDMIPLKTEKDKVDYKYFIERGDMKIIKGEYEINSKTVLKEIELLVTKYNINLLKVGLDPNLADEVKSELNSIFKDKMFCLNYVTSQTQKCTPVIKKNQYFRSIGKVYSNSKLSILHYASSLGREDNKGNIFLSHVNHKHDDIVQSDMAAFAAYSVFQGTQYKNTSYTNLNVLKKGFENNSYKDFLESKNNE